MRVLGEKSRIQWIPEYFKSTKQKGKQKTQEQDPHAFSFRTAFLSLWRIRI